MNIDRIISSIGNPTRVNKFDVNIFASKAGVRIRGIRCINAQLPGRTITSVMHSESGSAPKRSYPTGLDYDGQIIALTFLCDNQFEERRAMERWQEAIYSSTYGLNYPEEYHGTIEITQLDGDMEPVYTVKLNEAWPSVIAPQTLDATAGTFQQLGVTFNYTSWSSEFENVQTGILGGLFNKAKRKLKSKVKRQVEKKVTDWY